MLENVDPMVQFIMAVGAIAVLVGIIVLGRTFSVKFGRAEVRFDDLDTKTTQIKTKADSTDKQLNGRKATDTTVSADVAYIRSTMDEMRAEMNRHHGVVAEIQTTAAAAAGDAKVVKDLVMRQVGLVAGQQASLEALKGTVKVHGQILEGLQGQQGA